MTDHLPHIVSRDQHDFSRKSVDDAALKTLYRLDKAGYEAYLVGGCVRDILLGKTPKDFDVVTNAFPQQVRRLFGNSRIIGRRFKLVHVIFSGEVVEVSTFRGNLSLAEERETESELPTMITNDNVYGTLEEDVWRRDFTVNALYYNIANFSVVDYVGGLQDLKNKILRSIGEPDRRFREDPIRMLRAIRLAAKLGFSIETEAEKSIMALRELIYDVPPARVFDEFMKLFFTGNALVTYESIKRYDYLSLLFPAWQNIQHNALAEHYKKLVEQAMRNTDLRFHSGMTLNPGFLLSVLGWPILEEERTALEKQKKKTSEILHISIETTLKKLAERLAIPRRFLEMMRAIWILQYHLSQRRKRRVFQNLENRYFRAAMDFMELRLEVGENLSETTEWWRGFAASNADVRKKMMEELA